MCFKFYGFMFQLQQQLQPMQSMQIPSMNGYGQLSSSLGESQILLSKF